MHRRRVAVALGLAPILITGCGRQVESPFPESGLLRALARPNDLQLIKSPVSEWSSERDAVRVVEETLNFRVIGPSSSAAPLSFPLAQNPGLSLCVGEGKFSNDFALIRAYPDCYMVLEREAFRLRGIKYSDWRPTSKGGATPWWAKGELVAEAVVRRAGFYNVTLTAKGSRVYEAVPRLELLVDDQSVGEFDVFIPRRNFHSKFSAAKYLEEGNHAFRVRFANKVDDVKLRNSMIATVVRLELIPKDVVAINTNSLPKGTKVTARYETSDVTLEQWRLFADERNLARTEQGLFFSRG